MDLNENIKKQSFRLLKQLPFGVILVDERGTILFYNTAFESMVGTDVLPDQKNNLSHFFKSESIPFLLKESRDHYECILSRDDDEQIPVHVAVSKMGNDESVFILNVMNIEAHFKTETQLKEMAERFRVLFENSPDAIVLIDPNDKKQEWPIVDCNARFCEMNGFKKEELIGHSIDILHGKSEDPEVRKTYFQKLKKEGLIETEVLHHRKDGGHVIVQVSTRLVSMLGAEIVLGIDRDITEYKNMQTQLLHAQKLEAIGSLAAGIAHEINTPIQYVGDNAQFLKDSFNDVLPVFQWFINNRNEDPLSMKRSQEIVDLIKKIDIEYLVEEIPMAIDQSLEGIDQVSKIVRAMKEFSHPGVKEKILIDINQAIQTTTTVTKNVWKHVANLQLNLDPELPMVKCLPDELNQVFLNMITNAVDAIDDKMEKESVHELGHISISTHAKQSSVQIKIQDNGGGISNEDMDHIFDPFYTTKEIGKGTGQGLAISHSIIVDKHHGSINVSSEPGHGTCFTITLPLDDLERNEETV